MTSPDTAIVGVDHSPMLIETALRLTTDEGLSHQVTYQVADVHQLPYDDCVFDIVVLHTLLSHVDDPPQALQEARRVARPGGTLGIFDGDYASLTFAYPDPTLAEAIEEALMQLIVANPRIMRDMPRLVQDAGMDLLDAQGVLYAEIGAGQFWPGAAESYGSVLARSGLLPRTVVENWKAFQAQSVLDNSFFGACSYYIYLARRPDERSSP